MASYGCSEDPSGRYLLVVRVAADVFFPNAAPALGAQPATPTTPSFSSNY